MTNLHCAVYAVYIVQRSGGRIKAFLPIYDLSYDMTMLLSPEERNVMRKALLVNEKCG